MGWPSRARGGSSESRQAGARPGRPSPDGFFTAVYALARQIPRGKVATYGQIARLLGAPRSARVVGWAMHGNPRGSRVPCHRVVQQGGSLSPNYCLGDADRQRRLLEREGVAFLLDGRVDMAVHQWRPERDTGRPGRVGTSLRGKVCPPDPSETSGDIPLDRARR